MGPFSADRSRFERHAHSPFGAARRLVGVCGIALGVAVSVGSAAPPASALDDVRNATSLSSDQEQRIREFASDHYMQLCGSDLEQAEASRSALLHALRGSPVGTFRSTFMSELRTQVMQQLRGDNLFAKVNTVLLLSEIGNSSALDILDDNVEPRKQPAWQVRLATAKAIVAVINGPDRATFNSTTLAETARAVRDAATAETNPNAFRAQLVAIVACDRDALPAPTRIQIFRLFGVAAERVSNPSVAFDDRLAMANAIDAAADAIFPRTLRQAGAPGALPASAAFEIAQAYTNILLAYTHCETFPPTERRAASAIIRRLQTQIVQLAKSIDANAQLPTLVIDEAWDDIDSVEFTQYANAMSAAIKKLR